MSTTPPAGQDSLIEYPCDFPLKVMGKTDPAFAATMLQLLQPLDPQLHADKISSRDSTKGNYQALTITVHATSRAQLDDIYRALSSHPMVKMVL